MSDRATSAETLRLDGLAKAYQTGRDVGHGNGSRSRYRLPLRLTTTRTEVDGGNVPEEDPRRRST